jgi:hypothetical protein
MICHCAKSRCCTWLRAARQIRRSPSSCSYHRARYQPTSSISSPRWLAHRESNSRRWRYPRGCCSARRLHTGPSAGNPQTAGRPARSRPATGPRGEARARRCDLPRQRLSGRCQTKPESASGSIARLRCSRDRNPALEYRGMPRAVTEVCFVLHTSRLRLPLASVIFSSICDHQGALATPVPRPTGTAGSEAAGSLQTDRPRGDGRY